MSKVEFWTKHIADWQSSGLSQKDYCNQNDIKAHNLQYWRQRLSPEPHQPKRFVPVTIATPVLVRLILSDRTVIECPNDALASTLYALKQQGLIHAAA